MCFYHAIKKAKTGKEVTRKKLGIGFPQDVVPISSIAASPPLHQQKDWISRTSFKKN
jgi:hypothetical protein